MTGPAVNFPRCNFHENLHFWLSSLVLLLLLLLLSLPLGLKCLVVFLNVGARVVYRLFIFCQYGVCFSFTFFFVNIYVGQFVLVIPGASTSTQVSCSFWDVGYGSIDFDWMCDRWFPTTPGWFLTEPIPSMVYLATCTIKHQPNVGIPVPWMVWEQPFSSIFGRISLFLWPAWRIIPGWT